MKRSADTKAADHEEEHNEDVLNAKVHGSDVVEDDTDGKNSADGMQELEPRTLAFSCQRGRGGGLYL